MPTALKEMQFELLPGPDAPSGVVFGFGRPVSIDNEGFDPGEDEWADEDDANPRRGGRAFGRDTLNGPTWSFAAHVDASDAKTARDALAEIKTAWRAQHIRDTPGAVCALRYRLGGKTRRVYGRPRRFAAPPDNRIMGGYVPITMDFVTVDGYHYDDEEGQAVLSQAPPESTGGLILPATFPLFTLPVLETGGVSAFVGGDSPVYPVVTFRGPLTNPTLTHANWTLKLSMAFPAPDEVTVDLRPWAVTAKNSSGVSVAGTLSRQQRLSDMKFMPGQNPLSFRSTGTLSSGSVTVRWANAWNSL